MTSDVIRSKCIVECIDGTQAHHWDIEASAGSISKGTCRKCKQVQKFQNSLGASTSWHKTGVTAYQKYQLTNLGRKDKNNE